MPGRFLDVLNPFPFGDVSCGLGDNTPDFRKFFSGYFSGSKSS